MNRRGFLGAMLGGLAAPAIVKAEHLMKIVVPKQEIILPVKLRHQNGISGAFIGDMDINCMYDPVLNAYQDAFNDVLHRSNQVMRYSFSDHLHIARGTSDLVRNGFINV